ncbi:MAG: lysylphosphatidylglycerol synthase domain-containing protein [Terricaulis sp.]
MNWLWIGKRVLALAIAAACVWAIAGALRGQTFESLAAAFAQVPPVTLLVAGVLVAINFSLMGIMETLALRDAGVRLTPGRTVLSAFVGNALSIAAGLGPISGAGVRAGLFRAWGVPAQAAAVTAVSVTLISLSGGATLAAIGLILQPSAMAAAYGVPEPILRGCGVGFIVVLIGVMVLAGRKRTAFTLWGVNLSAPSAGGVLVRLTLGAIDWMISANILYVFLSFAENWAPLSFVTTFATSHFAGMAAGAPAGLGVFDALMLHAGAVETNPAQLAAALFLYRLVGYATPALIALIPYLALSQRTAAVR